MPFDALQSADTDSDLAKLVQARDLIRRGWCQNVSKDGDAYCMMGAIAKVTGNWDGNWSKGQTYRLMCLLGREINPNYCGEGIGTLLACYNDSRVRRKADVLRIFDKTIARISMQDQAR